MGLKWKQRLFAQKSQFLMESRFLMELPEKLLHSSGPACKVGSAQAAFLELGPAIITDKMSIDTVVNSLGWVEAVPADNALWSREGRWQSLWLVFTFPMESTPSTFARAT